jgi:hypothetical protein
MSLAQCRVIETPSLDSVIDRLVKCTTKPTPLQLCSRIKLEIFTRRAGCNCYYPCHQGRMIEQSVGIP